MDIRGTKVLFLSSNLAILFIWIYNARHRGVTPTLIDAATACSPYWASNSFDLAHTTALQNTGQSPTYSEEEPPMSAKVKSSLVFGALVLFSVAAQAALVVTPH